MLKMISRFAASPFSGYALIALLIAGAGAGYWFWSELKSFGALEAQSNAQIETINQQTAQLEMLRAEAEKRQKVNQKLSSQMAAIKRTFGAVRQRIQNAEANADKALKECMDMHIADGMRFGPSSDSGAGEG